MSTLMAGIAAFACTQALLDFLRRRRRLLESGVGNVGYPMPPILTLCMPAIERIKFLTSRLKISGGAPRIVQRLVAAGFGEDFGPVEFFTFRTILAFCSAVIAFAIFPGGGLFVSVAGGLAGWCYGIIWLGSVVRRRRRTIELALPDVLDLLTLSVEAGLDFSQSLVKVTSKIKETPLKDELLRLITDMRMGSTRRDALKKMAARAGVPALSSFSALLIQADQLGVSIGPVLRATAVRLRSERLAMAERRGVAAAQKALFPLAFCIMPATFVVVFGPLLVRLFTGGFDSLF